MCFRFEACYHASQMNGVEQLCPNCGLCCDSTLFADVELRAGDSAKRLAELGLAIEEKGGGKRGFGPPSPCFEGKFWGFYAAGLNGCGTFDGGLCRPYGG